MIIESYKKCKSHLLRWLFSIPPKKEITLSDIKKAIPFEIHEEYELNEFALDPIRVNNVQNLELQTYKYIKGDIHSIFNEEITGDILLFYNTDLLIKVEFNFKGNKISILRDTLKPGINPVNPISCMKKRAIEYFDFKLEDGSIIRCEWNKNENNTTLTIVDSKFYKF